MVRSKKLSRNQLVSLEAIVRARLEEDVGFVY